MIQEPVSAQANTTEREFSLKAQKSISLFKTNANVKPMNHRCVIVGEWCSAWSTVACKGMFLSGCTFQEVLGWLLLLLSSEGAQPVPLDWDASRNADYLAVFVAQDVLDRAVLAPLCPNAAQDVRADLRSDASWARYFARVCSLRAFAAETKCHAGAGIDVGTDAFLAPVQDFCASSSAHHPYRRQIRVYNCREVFFLKAVSPMEKAEAALLQVGTELRDSVRGI